MSMPATAAPPAGAHKSAVLLASLGTEAAARVLSFMDDRQVEALVREMTLLGHVPAQKRDLVVQEFQKRVGQDLGVNVGGIDYACDLLKQALGSERAGRIIEELVPNPDKPPTLEEMLQSTPPEALAKLMGDEHPQLLAVLASQLPVEKAASFLGSMPPEMQTSVAGRLAQMESPAPVAIEHLERSLADRLRSQNGGELGGPALDGPRKVADIMGRMRRAAEESLMASLEAQSPELARRVSRFRFTFDDLLKLDGKALQRVLREVENDTLKMAMKGLDEERQQTLFSNMSERAAARLREELENTGPTRLRDVETAQQGIVGIARGLADRGELQLRSDEEEEEEGG